MKNDTISFLTKNVKNNNFFLFKKGENNLHQIHKYSVKSFLLDFFLSVLDILKYIKKGQNYLFSFFKKIENEQKKDEIKCTQVYCALKNFKFHEKIFF